MKYLNKFTFFLIAILMIGMFLPQSSLAQRRPPTSKNKTKASPTKRKPVVRKTGSVRKSSKRYQLPAVSNPLVGVLLTPGAATIVPRCTEDIPNLVFNIYILDLFTQSMKYEDGQFFAFRQDADQITDMAQSTQPADKSNMPKKDPRWSSNFTNPKDLKLAQTLEKEFHPTEMQFYPRLAQVAVSTIVITRGDWTQQDVAKAYEIIKAHFGPEVPTNFMSECLTLPNKAEKESPAS